MSGPYRIGPPGSTLASLRRPERELKQAGHAARKRPLPLPRKTFHATEQERPPDETTMAQPLTIEDLRLLAKRRVPRMFYDYADSGAWTEGTYRANESDFADIKLRQRVAVDMTNRTLATTMIGQDVSMPVAIAPTGLTGMQHADGEILAAKAAARAGIPFTLSTMSICSIEDIAENTDKPFWFQLYVIDRKSVV